MLTTRQIGIETMRALCVLALLFLSFAHTPIAATAQDGDILTAALDASYCGDAPAGDSRGHAPCHACRIGGGADLPPPCAIAVPVAVIARVAYGAMPVLSLPTTPINAFDARGPPTA